MNSELPKTESPLRLSTWIPLTRMMIAIVVAIAIGYTLWTAALQLERQQFQFRQINYLWWSFAIISYVIAMTLSGIFWHRVLIAMDQRPEWKRSLAAFFISQLGKYVPGKAMVVVLRTDRVRGEQVAVGPAIVSVFIETFTWLFTASIVASVLLLILFEHRLLQLVALAMMIVAGTLTAPPVIRWLAYRMGQVKGKKTGKAMLGLTTRVMAPGWLLLTIGWCLSGLSLWLVLSGLPDISVLPGDYWLCLACVTLSTSVGFASLLPGGLGVRELVMIPLLSTRFESAIVVVAVVAIRLVWLISELLIAAVAHAVTKSNNVG